MRLPHLDISSQSIRKKTDCYISSGNTIALDTVLQQTGQPYYVPHCMYCVLELTNSGHLVMRQNGRHSSWHCITVVAFLVFLVYVLL